MKSCIFSICFFVNFFAYSEEITLAYEQLPPHIYEGVNGETTGPFSKLMLDYLAPEMGIKINLVCMPLARIFKAMDREEVDGIAIAGYTKARAEKYFKTKQSYYSMQPVLAMKKTLGIDTIGSVNDIKHLRIGYFEGGIVTPFIGKNEVNLINIFGSNVWSRNLDLLLKGRVDAIYSPLKLNMVTVIQEHQQFGGIDDIIVLNLPEKPIGLISYFTKSASASGIVNKFDNAMVNLSAPSLYKEILRNSFSNQEHESQNKH